MPTREATLGKRDYDALEDKAVNLIETKGLTENAASVQVAEDNCHPDDVDSVARHLRNRLRKRRERQDKALAAPAGAFALIAYVEERLDEYASLADTEADSLWEKLDSLEGLLKARLHHLGTLTQQTAANQARPLLGALPEVDFLATPDSLVHMEGKLLNRLLSRLSELRAKMIDDSIPF